MFIQFGKKAILVSAAVLSFCGQAYAAEPELLTQSGDWSAYVLKEGNGKICYMVSKPKENKGNYNNRGDIFALITHRPNESTRDVFSYISGYSYKVGSEATVTIDGKKHILFTQDDTAWAPDAESDSKLATAIKTGSKMTVQGTSSRGTLTTDVYSLKGATAAYKEISKACGM